ncbi:MAG: hypothetical protein J7497_09655, partial [Chitinophagaceae bacterium]|nr:hypothetical protein [Chitinophagaceae bacterium]
SNGNSALEFVNHASTSASYGVRLMASIDDGGAGLQFQYTDYQNSYAALNYKTGMFMSLEGNVGIGTTTPHEKLSVNGNVRAKEIKVEAANWPDYVFTPGYQLPSLESIAQHINEKGYLPNMPSAAEVSKEGIELGEMNKKLLEKVEELTLYLIEKDKEIAAEKQMNKIQAKQIESLIEQVAKLNREVIKSNN